VPAAKRPDDDAGRRIFRFLPVERGSLPRAAFS
jgi:hypothetical protein